MGRRERGLTGLPIQPQLTAAVWEGWLQNGRGVGSVQAWPPGMGPVREGPGVHQVPVGTLPPCRLHPEWK